jgi:hypothetical protein
MRLISREFVAPSIIKLEIRFEPFRSSSSFCYTTLDTFFNQCLWIKNLHVVFFDFGYSPNLLTRSLKDGFYRLTDLMLQFVRGDAFMFAREMPIHELRAFTFTSGGTSRTISPNVNFINSIAINNRSLAVAIMISQFNSSESLLKVVEFCRDLKSLMYFNTDGSAVLSHSDFKAIASLPIASLDPSLGGNTCEDD